MSEEETRKVISLEPMSLQEAVGKILTATHQPAQQPAVAERDAAGVTERVVQRIRDRAAAGLAKYGVTLDRADLTPEQWLRHLQEELLDGAGYIEAYTQALATERETVARYRAALEEISHIFCHECGAEAAAEAALAGEGSG